MKNLPIIVLLALVCAGCTPGAPQGVMAAALSTAAATQPAEPTVAPTFSPTVDYQATVTSANQVAATAQWDAFHARETAQAANVASKEIDLRILEQNNRQIELSTDQERAAAEKLAEENEAGWLQMTRDWQVATIVASTPTLIAAEAQALAQANTAQAREWVDVLVPIILSMTAFLLVGGFVWLLVMQQKDSPDDETVDADEEPETRPVYIQDPSLTRTVREQPPSDPDKLRAWILHALSGGSVAYNAVVGKDLPYATNGEYRPVWEWANRNGIIVRANGNGPMTLSTLGRRWGGEWLDANPMRATSPSPVGQLPENTPPASHDHENHGHDSGGGVVRATFEAEVAA